MVEEELGRLGEEACARAVREKWRRLRRILRRVARLGICDRQRGVEVGEEVARLLELVRERVVLQRDADDGDAGIHRRRELEEAPRPRQHRLRLHEHDGFGVAHVVEEVTQIAQVVGVEEDALAQLLLERALEEARLHRRLRLHVAHERAKLALARRRRGDRRQRRRRPFRCGDGERRCGSAYSPLAAARSAVGTGVGGGSAELRGGGRAGRSGSRMARRRVGRRRLLEQRRRLLQPAAQLQQQREQAAHAEDDEQPTEERVRRARGIQTAIYAFGYSVRHRCLLPNRAVPWYHHFYVPYFHGSEAADAHLTLAEPLAALACTTRLCSCCDAREIQVDECSAVGARERRRRESTRLIVDTDGGLSHAPSS